MLILGAVTPPSPNMANNWLPGLPWVSNMISVEDELNPLMAIPSVPPLPCRDIRAVPPEDKLNPVPFPR